MRVLFINEYAGYFGGVEQNIAHTSRALRARGHSTHLAYRAATDKNFEEYTLLFDQVHPCLELGSTSGSSIASLLSEVEPDSVYIHRVESVEPFLGLSHKVTRMIHDHDLCCPRRHKYYVWNREVCRHKADWRCWLDLAFLERDRSSSVGFRFKNLFAHKAEMKKHLGLDQLLVASVFMREELLMNGFADDKVQILAPLVPSPEREPTPPSKDPHILYVGQLITGKGVDLLLHALALLECPFQATIVGGGNHMPKLEALVQDLGLAEKVRLAGWIPHEELHALYENCRVVAVPSRWPEPYGMIGLEAMGYGRPVVGFAAGGIPDWLLDGENGFLIDEMNVEEFSRALALLLTDFDRAQELGRNGFELTRTRFSFERYIDELEGLLAL
jgi:glycosyltransferase involved in cell wall biosynthesis